MRISEKYSHLNGEEQLLVHKPGQRHEIQDVIDVGIEILPMKEMEMQMSSGVAYYERDLMNVIRKGRGVPAAPLVLVGVEP